jgi:hypothetical protein
MMHTVRTKASLIVLITGVALVAIGAGQISSAKRERVEAGRQTASQITRWHQQLSTEVNPAHRQEWNETGAQAPVALLRAFAVED